MSRNPSVKQPKAGAKRKAAPGTHRSPTFDYSHDFRTTNFREHPELYRVGRGEEGVLLVEPYKGEILPHWRFKTPAVARESAAAIYKLFLAYRSKNDFVGMDMARKYLQMGYTRARRYANHKGGRKYAADGTVKPFESDPVKAEAAAIFRVKWKKAEADPKYQRLRADHKARYG